VPSLQGTPGPAARSRSTPAQVTLSNQTGLSREELLARLSRELPDAVDKYTPQDRLPAETDVPRS
jgi:uncharacterized protein YidB (DUF937 family)